MAQASNRYSPQSSATAAARLKLAQITQPSTLFGADGTRIGPDGRPYVAEAAGSRVSAVDLADCAVDHLDRRCDRRARQLAFDSGGILYITEVVSEWVCERA